jgi:hypothetical protein
MNLEEAVDILEEVCPCTDPMCPDIVHRSLLEEARAFLREVYADDIISRHIENEYQRELDGPPANWEP